MKKSYEVNSRIKYGGKYYKKGQKVAMETKDAEKAGKVLTLIVESPKKEEK